MIVHMAKHRHHAVDYFLVLARARHLLREAQETLDQRALVDPDLMGKAARMCGTRPEWETFDPRDVSHFERRIGAIAGNVYVVGDSAHGAGLQVIQISPNEFEIAQHEIDFSFDVTLIGVAAPIIGLVHHGALCAVVKCLPAHGSPEDPRELERHLVRQVERRRKGALERVPLPVRQGMLEIIQSKRHIAAIKYLCAELKWSLVDAKTIVDSVDPWWPDDLAAATGSNGLS